jgi:hypothetical protein
MRPVLQGEHMNSSSIASIISGLTSASVVGYDISAGTPVSTTLGPGGAAITTTGAISQNTLVLFGIIAVALVAFLLLR